MSRTRAFLLSLLLLGFLDGCASVPPPHVAASPLTLPSEERAQVLYSLKEWQASGSASIQTARGSESFSYRWREGPAHQELSIYDPLGRTVARLTADSDGAELQTIDGKREKAQSLEALLAKVLHVQLPARELPLWMLGLTSGASAVQRNAEGLPETLHSGDWDIHYLRYGAVGGLQMPSLLQADGPEGVRLRLAVTRWQLGAGS
ncbi:MAG: lipoprotein insertase outer membrane protein LolB [Acidithiobacillus sp.]|uniref:lipoprotein insertase outer membrane protein LolB n=1 Tax=Acidithiobacillus sp. TaxID=1872118 RepID=UPI0025BFE22A|nr:lipoprotein insertase outer membrane protein LolB [Acidithiobacillus sp.]